jgi:hypothetical protein
MKNGSKNGSRPNLKYVILMESENICS